MARQKVSENSQNGKRREEIVNAAARLFKMHGYQGAAVRQIADEAGLTSGSIFYYFKSKEDLLEDVIAQAMQSGLQIVQDQISDATGSLSRFHALVLAHLTAITGPLGAAHEVSFQEWKSLAADARQRLQALNKLYRQVWMQILNDLKRNGYLFSDPEHCRRNLIAALNWPPALKSIPAASKLPNVANQFCSVALNIDEAKFRDLCVAEGRSTKQDSAA